MDERYICRICGYRLKFKIWGEDGKSPSYEICPCCGVEFGNEDYTLTSILNYRKRWIEAGCNWFLAQNKPLNWSYKAQLENVPRAYKL